MTLHEQDIVNNIPISELLQNISTRVFSLHEEIRRLKKKTPKWHKVADKLPEENQWVLVYDGSYTVCNYHSYTSIKWLDVYENEVYESNIIAWCEIPKYTEE